MDEEKRREEKRREEKRREEKRREEKRAEYRALWDPSVRPKEYNVVFFSLIDLIELWVSKD